MTIVVYMIIWLYEYMCICVMYVWRYACTVCVIWCDDLRLIYMCVIWSQDSSIRYIIYVYADFWACCMTGIFSCSFEYYVWLYWMLYYVYMWITMWITLILMWITFCCICNTFCELFENIVFSCVFVYYLLLSLIYSCFLTFSLYRNN